ncbi:MAG: hypothetical protein ACPG5B_07085 [Chitinophagales bacterium]
MKIYISIIILALFFFACSNTDEEKQSIIVEKQQNKFSANAKVEAWQSKTIEKKQSKSVTTVTTEETQSGMPEIKRSKSITVKTEEQQSETNQNKFSASVTIETKKEVVKTIDALEILVIPCYNGYEYELHNYDFNPIIEQELNNFATIHVPIFPFKKLKGVAFQGVFDKKYCKPIIEKTNADFFVMTKFAKNYDNFAPKKHGWGYETRILDIKTMKQINSIEAHGLKEYGEIEKHIKENIEVLKADIENMQ